MLELRDIEIFLTLAQELHFGRTAQRLHVSQARISQAVKQQERSVGAPLFERTSRSVRLTDVGRQLQADLQPVYIGLRESMDRARMAARAVSGRLRVGLMLVNFSQLHSYWRAFRKQYPQWELQIRVLPFNDPFGQLRRGEVDALVAWLPVEEADLTVGPTLLTDHRILATAEDHWLATRSRVTLEDLADFPSASADLHLDYWEDSYRPFQTRRGRVIERVHHTTQVDDLITLVGTGDIIFPFPSHVTQYWRMPDVRWQPLTDLPPLQYAMVWRTESENDLIRALAVTVRDLGPLEL